MCFNFSILVRHLADLIEVEHCGIRRLGGGGVLTR